MVKEDLLLRAMIEPNTLDLDIPEKIRDQGWWAASSLVKLKEEIKDKNRPVRVSMLAMSRNNIHAYMKRLMKQGLVEKDKLSYRDKKKREHKKTVYRLRRQAKIRVAVFRRIYLILLNGGNLGNVVNRSPYFPKTAKGIDVGDQRSLIKDKISDLEKEIKLLKNILKASGGSSRK